jgi:signal peptidase II
VIDWLASGSVLLFLDQWSKKMVRTRVSVPMEGPRIVRIRYVLNTKTIYASPAARTVLLLVWLAALVSAILLYRSGIRFQSHAALIGLGAAFGGAAGNLLDIMRRHGVDDFIDLQWWPVFNLADVAVVAGLAMAFWPYH